MDPESSATVVSDRSDTPSASQPEISLPESHEFRIEILERDSFRKFCLVRLANFVNVRSHQGEENAEEAQLHHKIADRAIYSAFRDCVAAGAEAEARRILDEASSQ